MNRVVAVIPARGGSKGIPRKNLVEICGRPLITWSVQQAALAEGISEVWVTSDSEEILEVAERSGARPLVRPPELAGDAASSESAWLHALEHIEGATGPVELVVGMQPTSPLRAPGDLDGALQMFREQRLDSLLSCCEIADFFIWGLDEVGRPVGVNHDPVHRQPRQAIERRFLENGSFYIFTPDLLRNTENRLGGRVGLYPMDKHKMFQIDEPEDVRLCEIIMQGYGLDRVA